MRTKSTRSKRNILIPITDWQLEHPIGVVCKSDAYYARLATRLANMLRVMIGHDYDISDEEIKVAAMDITAYFEDKLSGINLYNTFMTLYRERFGRFCPFYEVDESDWFDNEPNIPDIRFLLWWCLNRVNPDTLLNPLNQAIEEMSRSIYELLMDEFEFAPDSPELYEWLYDHDNFNDSIKIRSVCEFLASKSYLTATYDTDSCLNEIYNTYISFMGEEVQHSPMLAYGIQSYFSLNVKCGPLALAPQEWLGAILRFSGDEGLISIGNKISGIRTRSLLAYEIIAVHDDWFEVRSLGDETLKLSFDPLPEDIIADIKEGHIMVASLFEYDGFWKVNGISTFSSKKISLEEEIKLYLQKLKDLDWTYKMQIEKNNGSQIGVAGDFKEFERRFDLDKAQDTSTDLDLREEARKGKYLLYFINSNSSMSIIPDRAKYVALPDNPYYNKEEAEKYSALILIDDNSTEEMRDYLISHNLLPDARLKGSYSDEEAKKWFADNASFLSVVTHTDEVEFNMPLRD